MRIAVIGHGQLARMLALSGLRLGFSFSFLVDSDTRDADTRCVDGLGDIVYKVDYSSTQDIFVALGSPSVITVEKEQVDVDLLKGLEQHVSVRPSARAVSTLGHRYQEKLMLDELGVPTSAYQYIDSSRDAALTLDKFPVVAKSVSEGYDGRNQFRIFTPEDLKEFNERVFEGAWIVEDWVPFLKEASIVAARDTQGHIVTYPIAENVHSNGILVSSRVPTKDVSDKHLADIQVYIKKILEHLDYVGVIAMECFICENGVLINELAPRVHNSGHWTQSGSATCQFENHLRAIAGISLGSVDSLPSVGMVNLIGTKKPPMDMLSECSTLHWYNKAPRSGRKMGHINLIGQSSTQLDELMDNLLNSGSLDQELNTVKP